MKLIYRTIMMFFGGIVSLLAAMAMFAFTIFMLYLALLNAGLLGWAVMTGLLYLASHDQRMLYDAIQAFVGGLVSFGLIVAIFNLVVEFYVGIKAKLRRPRYALEFASRS